MPDINQQLKARLGLDTSEYERGLDRATNKAESAGRDQAFAFGRAAVAAGAVAAAVAAGVVALGQFAERGARVSSVQRQFNQITGNGTAHLEQLRSQTRGLVSDFDLMEKAVKDATKEGMKLNDVVVEGGDYWKQFKVEMQNTFDVMAQGVSQSGPMQTLGRWLADIAKGFRELAEQGPRALDVLRAAVAASTGLPFAGARGVGSAGPRAQHLDLMRTPIDRRSRPAAPPAPWDFTTTGPGGIRYDRATGRRPGSLDYGPMPDINVPEVSMLPQSDSSRRRENALRSVEGIRALSEETERWRSTIEDVANTIERQLVRSLTHAIMNFESIGDLVKGIGKSLLSGVVGGLVSFGIGALKGAALGALGIGTGGVGIGVAAAAGGIGSAASFSSGGTMSLRIDASTIPEPTDFGILASKPQVQKLIVAAVRNARANGAGI